jgi:hypothetical protein
MPMPVSRTSIRTSQRSALVRAPEATGEPSTVTMTSPRSVNFTAFDRRFSSIWRSRPASPMRLAGNSSSTA